MIKLQILLLLLPMITYGQVDHWESIILVGDEWQYLAPSSQVDENWTKLTYESNDWNVGNSGFGPSNNDDNVQLPSIISIYLRKTFEVIDISAIEEIILNMDYDDSYIAYLNGIEIARRFVSGNPPLYNLGSDELHEAEFYHDISPESIKIDLNLLNQGENILAVEVHNKSTQSSDLTGIPILSAGINNDSYHYRPTPEWFARSVSLTTSNLPIIIIDTENGAPIFDDPKRKAQIGIIYNGEGQLNNINDPHNEYSGNIGIEIRGESSQGLFPKKAFLFETWDADGMDIDTSFLNFPKEEDFILYAPYSDKSMMNNVLAMKIGNDMGRYSSRTRFVELVLNGEYQGLYVMMEKIKRDKDRVDIAKLKATEVEGDDLTGGYIIRIDKGTYQGWESRYNSYNTNRKIFFQYYYPDQNNIRTEQKLYIQDYVDGFEEAIASSNYTNNSGKRYTDYINLRSFVDNFIINELSKNVDGYRLSSYFHKDKDSKGGKLVAGPLWDFNLSFGNADYCGGDDIIGWIAYQCDHGGIPFWWDKMLQDNLFKDALRCRWESLRTDILANDNTNNFLDSLTIELKDPIDRNFQKWPILGTYVWPEPWYFSQANSHEEIMNTMKSRLENRANWLDLNIPGIAQDCEYYEHFDDQITDIPFVANPSDYLVKVYPNPSTGILNVESDEIINAVTIINILGQAVYKKVINNNSGSIVISEQIVPGTYFLSINTQIGTVKKTIIIE